MRILGIDPGLSTTGIGCIEADSKGFAAPHWLTIVTDPGKPLVERLAELSQDFDDILEEMEPDLAIVEQVFFAKNARTAIAVAHARGVLLAALGRRLIPVTEVTPMQLKSTITGDGSADKRQIGAMLCRILKLDAPPTPADASDALALAIYGALTQRGIQSITGSSPLVCTSRSPSRHSRSSHLQKDQREHASP